jgi:hypothetical protein
MKLRKVPRFTFWIGGLAAIAIALPLTSYALLFLARRLHIADPDATLERIVILSAVFAGFPTLLAGGGVARLVAHRVAEGAQVRTGLWKGMITMGAAGVGAMTLTAVAVGGLPEKPARWAPMFGAGLLVGLVTGLLISVLAALRAKRHAFAHRAEIP